MSNISAILGFIVSDEKFVDSIVQDSFSRLNDSNRKIVLNELLKCIFTQSRGVGANGMKKFGFVNSEWQALGENVLRLLEREHSSVLNNLKSRSKLFGSFNDFWPRCSSQLDDKVMSLAGRMEKSNPIVSIEEGYEAWLADLRSRLAAKKCDAFIFDKATYKAVKSCVEILTRHRELQQNKLNLAKQLFGLSIDESEAEHESKLATEPTYSTRSKAKVKVEEVDLDEDEKKEMAEIITEAEKYVQLDAKAWACVQRGLKGSINHMIQGLTARDAYLQVESLYGKVTHQKYVAMDKEFNNMEITDLSPSSIKVFLEDRKALVTKLQTLYPEEAKYSWDAQRISLANGRTNDAT